MGSRIKEEAADARRQLGNMLCLGVILVGLTIQSGMSWWWWLAAFFSGWVLNMMTRYGAEWWLDWKIRKFEKELAELRK